jgi:predicted MFS family arabinose efflux permease
MAASIPRRLVLVMAVAAGLAVANNYYAQPLLATIARYLHVGNAAAGFLITVNQIGYAVGLVAVVPLGDLLERRRLVTALLGLSVLALTAAAFSPTLAALAGAGLAIGLTSVVAQIIVPFAASLAAEHERGRVVGTVMSGLLIGILLARTVSGFVGDAFGWRAIYALAAVLMVGLVGVLWHELPDYRERHAFSYPQLLRSVWRLIKEERVLRYRSVYGACVFAAFSVFWTTAAFLLSGQPYQYSNRIIGLFGLFGVAGVAAASVAGRFADRGWARGQTAALLLCTLVSWLPIALGGYHLAPLVLGIVLMDIGVHGTQITNQSEIYRLNPSARSRLTTAYMAAYFVGGAGGSLAGALLYDAFGWSGVCCAGAAFIVVALVTWMAEGRPSQLPRAQIRSIKKAIG